MLQDKYQSLHHTLLYQHFCHLNSIFVLTILHRFICFIRHIQFFLNQTVLIHFQSDPAPDIYIRIFFTFIQYASVMSPRNVEDRLQIVHRLWTILRRRQFVHKLWMNSGIWIHLIKITHIFKVCC